MQEQPWFEMPEIRRWPLDRAAWIPLRESHKCDEEGEFGREGYREGFVGAGTIAFLVEDRPVCEHLGWHDIGISHSQRGGCFSDGRYPPAGVFLSRVPPISRRRDALAGRMFLERTSCLSNTVMKGRQNGF